MAAINIKGKHLMRSMTVVIDATRLERQAFGIFGWRLWLARRCFGLGVTVLRCGLEIKE
jgi:hypothetical protein